MPLQKKIALRKKGENVLIAAAAATSKHSGISDLFLVYFSSNRKKSTTTTSSVSCNAGKGKLEKAAGTIFFTGDALLSLSGGHE